MKGLVQWIIVRHPLVNVVNEEKKKSLVILMGGR